MDGLRGVVEGRLEGTRGRGRRSEKRFLQMRKVCMHSIHVQENSGGRQSVWSTNPYG